MNTFFEFLHMSAASQGPSIEIIHVAFLLTLPLCVGLAWVCQSFCALTRRSGCRLGRGGSLPILLLWDGRGQRHACAEGSLMPSIPKLSSQLARDCISSTGMRRVSSMHLTLLTWAWANWARVVDSKPRNDARSSGMWGCATRVRGRCDGLFACRSSDSTHRTAEIVPGAAIRCFTPIISMGVWFRAIGSVDCRQ